MFFSSSGKWCFFKNSVFLLYAFECLAVPGEIWIGAGGCLAPEDMAWIHSKVNISGNADLQDVPENLLFIWCLCKKNAFAKQLFRFWLWMHWKIWIGAGDCHVPETWWGQALCWYTGNAGIFSSSFRWFNRDVHHILGEQMIFIWCLYKGSTATLCGMFWFMWLWIHGCACGKYE